MPETQPQYFIEFRKDFTDFKKHVDDRFDKVDKKIEEEVGGLALSTADEFRRIDNRFGDIESDLDEIKKNMVTQEDIAPILQHIGAYEIRAKNIEKILLDDHKPRIIDLEKKVFA